MSSENFFAVLQLPPHGTYENLVCKKNLELNLPSLLEIHDNHEKSMKKELHTVAKLEFLLSCDPLYCKSIKSRFCF